MLPQRLLTARALACAVPFLLPAPAVAADAAPPDPALAVAPVPALRYQSALAGYRPLADDKSIPWRRANDAAAAVGGWRFYAREARQPASPPGAASAAGGGSR